MDVFGYLHMGMMLGRVDRWGWGGNIGCVFLILAVLCGCDFD